MRLNPVRTTVLSLLAALALVVVLGQGASAQDGADQETLEQGAQIYLQNCAVCHGENGEGRIGATLAKDWPAIRPELDARNIIINGVPGTFMPPWSMDKGGPLSEEEIEALVVYILSWQTGEPLPPDIFPSPTAMPPIQPVPGVEGDPNLGAVLYAENCALCHGEDGEGRIGATLAKDWPAIRPDLNVQNIVTNGVPNTFMPPWSQEAGGPLTEEQVNDLVAFILTWSVPAVETATLLPTQAPTPTPAPAGGNMGLIVSAIVVVIIIVGGVILVSRSRS